MRIVTWNIGGAKTLEPGADPTLMESYNIEAIDYIVDKLKETDPDIIAFQEIQKSKLYDQASIIASKLGYDHFVHESFSWSHNEDGAELGNAIISKLPLSNVQSGVFLNPKVTVTWEDGRTAETHDKGFVSCTAFINGKNISITTLHLTPFRKFGMKLTDPKAVEVLADVASKTMAGSEECALVLGDFNIDNPTVNEYFDSLSNSSFKEVPINSPTTPKDRRYDHVLYRNMELTGFIIDSTVTTDHFLVITDFEL